MVTSTYYHPLFRKLDKTLLIKKFNEFYVIENKKNFFSTIELSIIKRMFIEFFVILLANKKGDLEKIDENIDFVVESWLEEVSFLKKKLTHELPKSYYVEKLVKYKSLFIESLSYNDKDKLKDFLKLLEVDMHLAEYRGLEMDEEIEFPPSLITTSERRTFFMDLFPPNIKF